MSEIDCVVVGAGVVGLAVARRMARAGYETIVLEQATHIGSETSSRNSEVIHAGIYYPNDSLKAKLCVAGKHQLYDYCQSHNVPHRNCGKLIVATSEEQAEDLVKIQKNAAGNGVPDLQLLSRDDALSMEPSLDCVAALYSPSTGIIDSHQLMLAFQGELEDAGGMIAFGTRVSKGLCHPDESAVHVETEGEAAMTLTTRMLINCAGLHAQGLAAQLDGFQKEFVPETHYAKGNYYSLNGRAPFSRLIYPVPEPGGLGVHLTIDLGGSARFGPDVEWTSTLNYDVDPARSAGFYDAIRRYWPGLPDDSLSPGYAGIRPKLVGAGEPANDFVIQGPDVHGQPGLVNLFGIESPGLTASMAIADEVYWLLEAS